MSAREIQLKHEKRQLALKHEQACRRLAQAREEMIYLEKRAEVVEETLKHIRR